MTTKLDTLKTAWSAGDKLAALRIAAKFPDLGAQKDAIQRGWDAAQRPDFYQQIKKDPEGLLQAAYTALAERYKLAI